MPTLHKSTSIYADFEEVIVKTDEFVCSRLYESLKDDKNIVSNSIIRDFFTIIEQTGQEYISDFSETKNSLNPLVDIADVSSSDDEMIVNLRQDGLSDEDIKQMICDQIYDDIMACEYGQDVINTLRFTNFADSIKILLKDNQLEKVYIYIKVPTQFIHDVIYQFFMENDKIVVVTGDKENFLKSVKCDTYVFKDIKDIQFLPEAKPDTTEIKRDVIMMSNDYNIKSWLAMKDDNNGDLISHNNIKSLYNIDVSLMK